MTTFYGDYLRSCGIKRSYPTRAAAAKAQRQVGGGVRPYLCFFCKGWHLGHSTKTRGAA